MEELERSLSYLPGWNGFDIFQRENTFAISAQVWSASDASAVCYALTAEDAGLVRADAASRRFGSEDVEALALDLDDWGLADMSASVPGPPFQ